jgi:hypothetical protein
MRTEYDNVIRAWLDGAEVEVRTSGSEKWVKFGDDWNPLANPLLEYRIAKPAQEPKYLYAYRKAIEEIQGNIIFGTQVFITDKFYADGMNLYLGKIRLEE